MIARIIALPANLLAVRRIRIWLLLFAASLCCIYALYPLWSAGVKFDFTGLSPSWVLALLFGGAMVCEYIDSSLGMGYGTALTPTLLLVGFEPLQIVPCILFSEFITGLAAVAMHQRDANVDFIRDRESLKVGGLLSVLSLLGALFAVVFAVRISADSLKIAIAIIVLGAGLITLLTAKKRLQYRKRHIIALGALAAFNKGMSGGGYGPLVTAGQVVSGIEAKKAVAITSLAESFTCLVGLGVYFMMGKEFDWMLALPLTAGAVLSVPLATYTVKAASENKMRIGVGIATCALGGLALAKIFW